MSSARDATIAQSPAGAGDAEDDRMVEQVARLAVTVTVKDGQREAFKVVAARLIADSVKEPGTIGYEWFADANERTFYLLETYVDAAALEAHFEGPAVREGVPQLAALCKVDRFEIYGTPTAKVAEIAAGFGAVVRSFFMGLGR
jgi:quinol monooxygenase YgiN